MNDKKSVKWLKNYWALQTEKKETKQKNIFNNTTQDDKQMY